MVNTDSRNTAELGARIFHAVNDRVVTFTY
jgi:hypothetical protein